MNRYFKRARSLATINTLPTMTDQAGASETDINVIVKRYGVHGQVPGANGTPSFEDLANFPDNLRDILDTARGLDAHFQALPPKLQEIPFGDLVNMTDEQIRAILTPVQTPKPTEEQK